MAYTTINKSKDHFDGKIYLGSSSAITVTGLEFQPDLVWVKDRDNGNNHCLVDAVRGVGKYIQSDNNSAEVNNSTNSISAFTSDGFTVGTGNPANESASTTKGFMSWNWKANGQGSANTTAGFSIVKYTGTGSVATVGHGLGVAPKMMIIRILGDVNDWQVYHQSIGNTHKLNLNTTEGSSDQINRWNDTSPTSSVFTLGGHSSVNANGSTYIAYCFAEKTGYSKFGSYTGNGNADGSFIYTGFKPAFLIIKRTDTTKNWYLHDSKRDGYNNDNPYLSPNLTATETGGTELDLYSNGFKMRSSGTGHNESGGSYIYMAFGQSLVGSNNVPCTAR